MAKPLPSHDPCHRCLNGQNCALSTRAKSPTSMLNQKPPDIFPPKIWRKGNAKAWEQEQIVSIKVPALPLTSATANTCELQQGTETLCRSTSHFLALHKSTRVYNRLESKKKNKLDLRHHLRSTIPPAPASFLEQPLGLLPTQWLQAWNTSGHNCIRAEKTISAQTSGASWCRNTSRCSVLSRRKGAGQWEKSCRDTVSVHTPFTSVTGIYFLINLILKANSQETEQGQSNEVEEQTCPHCTMDVALKYIFTIQDCRYLPQKPGAWVVEKEGCTGSVHTSQMQSFKYAFRYTMNHSDLMSPSLLEEGCGSCDFMERVKWIVCPHVVLWFPWSRGNALFPLWMLILKR